jgi:hypothetical protein
MLARSCRTKSNTPVNTRGAQIQGHISLDFGSGAGGNPFVLFFGGGVKWAKNCVKDVVTFTRNI